MIGFLFLLIMRSSARVCRVREDYAEFGESLPRLRGLCGVWRKFAVFRRFMRRFWII